RCCAPWRASRRARSRCSTRARSHDERRNRKTNVDARRRDRRGLLRVGAGAGRVARECRDRCDALRRSRLLAVSWASRARRRDRRSAPRGPRPIVAGVRGLRAPTGRGNDSVHAEGAARPRAGRHLRLVAQLAAAAGRRDLAYAVPGSLERAVAYAIVGARNRTNSTQILGSLHIARAERSAPRSARACGAPNGRGTRFASASSCSSLRPGEMNDRKKSVPQAGYLASIVESSDDAILSKDTNGIIQSANAASE